MLATKLSSCEWTSVALSEWARMRCSTPYEDYLDNEYSESDFDNFVEILFREFAERIKARYCDVRDILYGHNTKFFEVKARYFSEYDSIEPREDEFKSLTKMLLLPRAYEFESQSSVQAFLDSFSELELEDKLEILDRLSSAKLEIGQPNSGPATCVKNSISALPQQDKYKLVKSVFEAEVVIDIELR